jgi:hypothetical protein
MYADIQMKWMTAMIQDAKKERKRAILLSGTCPMHEAL